jgi:hypothetical protein
MKRMLLALAAALLFLNTLMIPTVVHADGGPNQGDCTPNVNCKP